MSTLTFITRSGSKYTIDNQGVLHKNGKPLDQSGDPLIYIGIVNWFKFIWNDDHILEEFCDYATPEEIKAYLDTCPPKETIINNLKRGQTQSYLVIIAACNKPILDALKNGYNVTADPANNKIFMKELEKNVLAKFPKPNFVYHIPYSYVTTVLTHYEQE